MSNFDNAYNASYVISDLANHVEAVGGSAIHSCAEIIQREIDNVPSSEIRHDRKLALRMNAVYNLCHIVSMQAFNVEKNDAYADAVKLNANVLFRCVSDIQSDLNNEERFDWSAKLDHWRIAAELYAERANRESWKIEEAA